MKRLARLCTAALLVSGLALALAGCLDSPAVQCEDGLVCPPGTACSTDERRCVVPEQQRSCDGRSDGESCSYPGVPDGTCDGDLCVPSGCGNGIVEEGEVCDDGNREHGDGCNAECTSDETCGNGVVDTPIGEACDDGNTEDGDGCQSNCTAPTCGDGVVDTQFNEACDEGEDNSDAPDATCRENCQPQRCGDGILDSEAGEVCDDGNLQAGDGCTPDCQSDETCGNGVVDFFAGEQCDDGNLLSHDGCSSSCEPEQPRWEERAPAVPPKRRQHAMAYDAARGRVVLFGGEDENFVVLGDTWEWNGASWTEVTPASGSPPPREDYAMVYDAARRRVVLFGGINDNGFRADTWEWDGASWTEVSPDSGSPPARKNHAMAYDAARERVVLFGGANSSSDLLGDTWVWDGTSWTEVNSDAASPSARAGHQMSYDPSAGRVVLFGGYDGDRLGDTWLWDGANWTEIAPGSISPPARSVHQMVYDTSRSRVLLFGGIDAQVDELGDTWAWDGTSWTEVSTDESPSARFRHAMAYNAASESTVLFGGSSVHFGELADTWQFDGTSWAGAAPNAQTPPARWLHAMAHDAAAGRVVVFDGDDETDGPDTWAWDGTSWTDVTPDAGNPPARTGHAMAYDGARDRVVLFGGSELNDTWAWDGTSWTDVTPDTGNPPGRFGHALAYDASERRVVLFGGHDPSGNELNDTWEWDGERWTDVTPDSGLPPPRADTRMVYDAARERVVLFGGARGSEELNDTWEWDGETWTDVTPDSGLPPPRAYHALAYDAGTRRTVVFGGLGAGFAYLGDTWEWDGKSWTEVITDSTIPEPREAAAMVYDGVAGRVVLFGGEDADFVPLDDTWHFGYERAGDPGEACRLGTADYDRDQVLGCDDPDCWGYCTPHCPPGTSCPADAPRCGDGICNASLETCQLCPGDCGPCPEVCGDYVCDPGEDEASCPGDCATVATR